MTRPLKHDQTLPFLVGHAHGLGVEARARARSVAPYRLRRHFGESGPVQRGDDWQSEMQTSALLKLSI